MNKRNIIWISLVLSSCYLGEELPDDQRVWPYANPSTVGLDEEALLELDRDLKEGYYDQVRGMIIIKDDRLIFENYYNSGSRDELRPIGRATFSIMAVLLDLFIQDGLITDVGEPIYPYLPDHEMIFEGDEQKKQITFEHLLTHRSGLAWDENPGSVNNDLTKMKQNADWAKYILSRPLEAPPGWRTVNNTGSGYLLSLIFQNLLGDLPLEDYLSDRFFEPIGIKRFEWLKSPDNVPDGSGGLFISTMDLTRIGYLLVQEGRWIDKRRIISADWVWAMRSEQAQVSANYSYGYGWYIFAEKMNEVLSLESSSSFLSGETGQNLYILPGKNMVICIMADNYFSSLFNPSFSLFARVLRSVEPGVMK